MTVFEYQAINRTGQHVQGRIEAADAQAAVSLLAERGQFVDKIARVDAEDQPAAPPVTTRSALRLSGADRAAFIGQFAAALQAHLPVMTALQVVGQQNPRSRVKRLAAELAEIISSGQSLSEGMAQYGRVFDRLDMSLVAVGESSGRLDQSMAELADLTERERQIRGDIMTAALYPAFVLLLGLISVVIVVTWILPRVLNTLAMEVGVLPWPTRTILAVSEFLKSPGGLGLLGGLVLAVILAFRWKKTTAGRYLWDGCKLRTPLLGHVQNKWAISRFARMLGTITRGGVNILDALQIVRDTLGNEVLGRQVDRLARHVRTGGSLSEAMRQSGRFGPLLVQVVVVGEETGQLADLLLGAAVTFDKETQLAVKRFMSLLPAVLVTILALVVGFIVAATLLPIVQIETAIPGL